MLARALLLLVALLLPVGASATVVHGSFVTNDFTFSGVQETTQTPGDPEPLFGAPIDIDATNALIFFPTNFTATATGAGGADTTLSLLQMTISSNNTATDFIETINISEFGDTTLSGVGTAATNTAVSVSGFVTVLQANGVPIFPVVIPFNFPITPSNTFALPGDAGTTIWTGFDLEIDVASFVANATLVQFSLNNQLDAFSELSTSATIQKKGQFIISVPEPGSFVALGSGVLMVLLHGRRRLRA